MKSVSSAARPLVSVIIPVYNAGRHLEPCVRSVLDQTYETIEIIVVNDGSTDGSGEILDRLAAEDARVRVVHQENAGIASAQNAGLDIAEGELITFCDNDDLMLPRMLERLVGLLLRTGADMSCCRWRNVGASRGQAELRKHRDDPFGRFEVFRNAPRAYQLVFAVAVRRLLRMELRYFSEANWGKLYRATLFDGLRFPPGRYAQDVAVAMPLYRRMSKVVSCSDGLYLWLQRGDSVSHALKSTSYYSDIVSAHARSFDLAMSMGITPARAYLGLKAIDVERRSVTTPEEREIFEADESIVSERLSRLSFRQRMVCTALFWQRMLEMQVYNRTVHRRR